MLLEQPSGSEEEASSELTGTIPEDLDAVSEVWNQSVPLAQIPLPKMTRLRQLLNLRHITDATMVKFNVRAVPTGDGLIFPRYTDRIGDKKSLPTGIKICKLFDGRVNMISISEQLLPDGNNVFPGLFGYNLLKTKAHEVALALNEADAMAIFQATGKPALAVPLEQLAQMHPKLISVLKELGRVVIWPPPDKFVKTKGIAKTFAMDAVRLVSPTVCKNLRPVEAIAMAARGKHLIASIVCTVECRGDRKMATFSQSKELAREYFFGHGYIEGIAKWKRFATLNAYLKGFRMGELTLVCGTVASGKKTFMSEYALDLCCQQVRTLWCCLESTVGRIAATMVEQYARESFYENSGSQRSFDFWYQEMGQLPLQFASFGNDRDVKLKELLELIDKQNAQHIVIDNLHSLYEASAAKNGYDLRLLLTDTRRFCATRNVHITVVVRLVKEDNGTPTIMTPWGEMRGWQDADNILLITMYPKMAEIEKSLKILKNRQGGELEVEDNIEMYYNRSTKCHTLSSSMKFIPNSKY